VFTICNTPQFQILHCLQTGLLGMVPYSILIYLSCQTKGALVQSDQKTFKSWYSQLPCLTFSI